MPWKLVSEPVGHKLDTVGITSRYMVFTSVPFRGDKNEQEIRELLWLKLEWGVVQILPIHL